MSSLEEIKKKLSIDEMDNESRKQMFNKFVEKGGQVIKEDINKNKAMKFNRSKQIEVNNLIQNRENELRKNRDSKSDHNSSSHSFSNNSHNKKIKYPFMIFIKGMFQGIFTLSGQFNKKYITAIDLEFQDILSGLNFVCSQILNLDNENKWKLVDSINKHFTFSYEIIMRIYNLYKLTSINNIQNYMKTDANIQCTTILRNIHALYKDLVILFPYWETNKDILWRALGYYEKLSGNHSVLSRNKINKNLDRLFNFYLPFFHITLCYNLGDNIVMEFESMKEFAQVTEEESMGIYTTELNIQKKEYIEELKKEKEERKKKLQESVEQKEIEKIPVYIQKGLKFIDDIFSKKDSIIKNDKKAELFEENDKMLYFYLLFKEFDRHYSFILTTSQLKLITRLESGIRTDIRSELDEEFIKFNELGNFIKEYLELLEEQNLVIANFQDHPVQQRAKTTNISIKRAGLFNDLKARASIFFKSFSITLQKMITDFNNQKLLLQNPEDLLSFQLSREKNRFDNVQIIKAIGAAFSYSSAIHYYITFDEFSQKSLYFEKKNEEITQNEELDEITQNDSSV
ncbi:MAG: hypothetical protein A2015_09980 [Spirochaetes bacterium GWF1_31_7]|nr:MAG: hypothetical protein A2Y30_10735 [Spirochaetes bacterium GWE1_32_154]OHD48284.1 MAG: hypothetical protein A2015_09980 [Spirochaetes bacterium GWF1_31_7]HBI37303.1 hypothetical protein [Spirochaetia bacterium]